MLLHIFRWVFERLIGAIPPSRQAELRKEFQALVVKVIRAASEGAARGASSSRNS